MKTPLLAAILGFAIAQPAFAQNQVNTGSNGSDGAFNPTQNVTIDMSDHPTGIYQYSSVNIPAGVTVTFKSNAKNTPVVWLVQGSCVISGTVNISGQPGNSSGQAGAGGPGGWAGGNGGNNSNTGQGPGGGLAGIGGSYATKGGDGYPTATAAYGNSYLLPLQGGSGGGANNAGGGGGGGGAILIAASTCIQVNGAIVATGGLGSNCGHGSGGGIRLVSTVMQGTGNITAALTTGGAGPAWVSGSGWVRFDTFQNSFGGTTGGTFTQGFQPIIIPAAGQGVQFNITSVGGVAVAASPGGVLANPDVIIPAQQSNPVPVVVACTNIPLNTQITVVAHPAVGADVSATGINNVGAQASSTATINLNMPRGGGIIYAEAVTGLVGTLSANGDSKSKSLAQTGWTATGESFTKMEITAVLGGKQRIAYITASGKRFQIPAK